MAARVGVPVGIRVAVAIGVAVATRVGVVTVTAGVVVTAIAGLGVATIAGVCVGVITARVGDTDGVTAPAAPIVGVATRGVDTAAGLVGVGVGVAAGAAHPTAIASVSTSGTANSNTLLARKVFPSLLYRLLGKRGVREMRTQNYICCLSGAKSVPRVA